MDLDFDKIYRIPTTALYITRTHPYLKRDIKWLLHFAIVHGIFTSGFILVTYNIIHYNFKINNFSQTCKNGIFFVVYIVITFQYCILLWHQKPLVAMIKDMNRDYEMSKDFDLKDRNVILKYVNLSGRVCEQWSFVTVIGCSLFFVKSSVLMLYYYIKNEFRLVPLYDLIYPTIIEENKENIFIYLLTYMYIGLYCIYTCFIYIAFVPLGPIFMLHVCGQLEIVERQINNLFVDYDEHVIRDKFKRIIQQLQYVYSFVERIQGVYMVTYEFTLKATSLVLPITFYAVIETLRNGEISLEFISFIIGGILISGSPCYYSDLLMEKGEDVRLSLYTCGWEMIYDRRARTTLQLMLLYALRPIAIRTVFRPVCLDALTDVFQQSYAFFNLMNAMWN